VLGCYCRGFNRGAHLCLVNEELEAEEGETVHGLGEDVHDDMATVVDDRRDQLALTEPSQGSSLGFSVR
jgi:hypothetical protein